MSNKLDEFSYYHWLTHISKHNFKSNSVIILGSGNISKKYAEALFQMKISDVTIVSKTSSSEKLAKHYGFKSLIGGYENNLKNIPKSDLAIIALPVNLLLHASRTLLELGHNNLLIEKPASLYYKELEHLHKKYPRKKIHVAYNRILYPNLHKLKKLVLDEGGILSCKFSITEQINRFKISSNNLYVYKRLGIANTLHVISMVVELIGYPKKLHAFQSGKIKWHQSGSIFVGSGITNQNIPFSYHGNWNTPGGWGIEILTKKRRYLLTPLEKLFYKNFNDDKWKPVKFKISYPNVKAGMAEEIALMLNPNIKNILPTLVGARKLNLFAEKIFGYD